jgi:hypothetical protein
VASRPPFSRQRDRRGDRDQWAIVRAADFVAQAYGWGPQYLESGLTDEQLVAYLDAGQERLNDEGRARFDEAIEAVRMGTIFSQDAKQYGGWVARRPRPAPSGRDLAKLAADFGGRVTHGEPEFRNN